MLALSACTLLLFQQAAPPVSFRKLRTTGAPQYAGVYHPATGLQPGGNGARFGPELIWNSHRLGNYYSVPGADQEWIDEGVLPVRHAEPVEQINGMRFTYCTTVSSTNGLSGVVRFYDETAGCSGPLDWPASDCEFAIAGLPGAGQGNSLTCWTVDLDLSGFECDLPVDPAQTQLFGWSMTWAHHDTGSWLTSHPMPPGGECYFTWFDRTESSYNTAFLGCYWFSCIPPEQFACALYGQPPDVFAESSPYGPGQDATLKLAALDTLQIDQAPMIEVREIGSGHLSGPSQLWISRSRVDLNLEAVLGIDARLLVPRRQLVWDSYETSGFHMGVPLPAVAQGKTYFIQAAQYGAGGLPIAFTAHALRVTVQ